MPKTIFDALAQEFADIPEDILNRFLKLVGEWENGELRLKFERDRNARMKRFYTRFIDPGDLVFDIGANVGDRAEIFKSLGAKVIAAEPHPSCIQTLRQRFQNCPEVIVVPVAMGCTPGVGNLVSGECTGISSLSDSWISAVSATNRFDGYQWTQKYEVQIDTLDSLIAQYGVPKFIKIDVEGFEDQVLSGLSTPVAALSFEFNSEFLQSTEKCLQRLENLGKVEFTYSTKETMELHPEWVSGQKVLQYLAPFASDNSMYGDVYARFA